MTGDMKYVQIDSEGVNSMCDVAERLTEKGKTVSVYFQGRFSYPIYFFIMVDRNC